MVLDKPVSPHQKEKKYEKLLGNDQKEKQNPAEENNKVISKKERGPVR